MHRSIRFDLRRSLLAASTLGCALASGQTLAQAAEESRGAVLEEVIVTAQKREENLQETPIAISALSADAIERLGVTSFADIAAVSPALATAPYPSSSNSLFVFIRGQGVGDPAQITKDGSVGLYVDGLYISRAMATTFDLADIERIEVLRGPQGTLYGRNTTGGAVNIITVKPSGEFGFSEKLTIGNYSTLRSLTTLDLPAWNGLSAKLSFVYADKDGFVENIGDSNDYNDGEEVGGRVALRWEASDSFTADYAFEIGDANTTPVYYQNELNLDLIPGYNMDRFETYRPIDLLESESKYQQHSLTLSWDLSENVTLRSLTGYRDLEMFFYQDYNESFNFNVGTWDAPFLFPLGFQSDDDIEMDQFSQEFQIVGSALDGNLTYTAGLYYFEESGDHGEIVSVQIPAFGIDDPGSLRYVEAEAKSKAAYAQVTWTPSILDERLDLTVGARYTEDERKASKTYDRAFPGTKTLDEDFSKFNPAGTIGFRWTDDLMTYIKVATGYRAGGFSESSPDFEQGFDPEEVTSYEFGIKSDLFGGSVRANLAAFVADYEDLQLDLSPNANDLSLTDTYNAGEAQVDGVELDLSWAVLEGLTLTASYVHLEYDIDFIDANLSPALLALYGPNGNAAGAFNLAFAPEDNWSLAADYVLDGLSASGNDEFVFHVDVTRHDEFYGSTTSGPDVPNGEEYLTPDRTLLNARIGYTRALRNGRLQAALWGKNLTDEDWPAHVIGNGDVNGYYGHAQARGEPRTYGVELSFKY
jgi:iron complex outermembrane receptor protein